jgi:hypothetical protein
MQKIQRVIRRSSLVILLAFSVPVAAVTVGVGFDGSPAGADDTPVAAPADPQPMAMAGETGGGAPALPSGTVREFSGPMLDGFGERETESLMRDPASPLAWEPAGPLGGPGSVDLLATQDPLAETLHTMVSGPAARRREGGLGRESRSDLVVFGDDEDLKLRLRHAQDELKSALEWALAAAADEQGQGIVDRFGIGGFSLAVEGEPSDPEFDAGGIDPQVEPSFDPFARQSSGVARERDASIYAESERNAIAKLMFLFWDIVTHPMTLGLAVFVTIVRLVLAVARLTQRRHARRAKARIRRRSRSRSRSRSRVPAHDVVIGAAEGLPVH